MNQKEKRLILSGERGNRTLIHHPFQTPMAGGKEVTNWCGGKKGND